MPAWITHLDVATKVCDKLKIEKNRFLIGNLMPDAERHVVKDFSIFVPWEVSHFGEVIKINGINMNLPNISNFLEKYKVKLDNPVVLGYLSHLLTDYYYNKETYLHHTIPDKAGNKIGIILKDGSKKFCDRYTISDVKHNDFNLFQDYLRKKQEFDIPIFTENMMKDIMEIEEVPYNNEDIKKIIKYVNENKEEKYNENIDKNYIMLTSDEMKREHENCVKFVYENIIKYKEH